MKMTSPPGTPPVDVTDAVSCTDWPTGIDPDGPNAVVVVVAAATVWVTVFDVLAPKLPLAPYAAEIVWDPTPRALVVNLAFPDPSRATDPTLLPSMVNVTEPVGVPDPEDTVAVKSTD
jgi:hypothetical protein